MVLLRKWYPCLIFPATALQSHQKRLEKWNCFEIERRRKFCYEATAPSIGRFRKFGCLNKAENGHHYPRAAGLFWTKTQRKKQQKTTAFRLPTCLLRMSVSAIRCQLLKAWGSHQVHLALRSGTGRRPLLPPQIDLPRSWEEESSKDGFVGAKEEVSLADTETRHWKFQRPRPRQAGLDNRNTNKHDRAITDRKQDQGMFWNETSWFANKVRIFCDFLHLPAYLKKNILYIH